MKKNPKNEVCFYKPDPEKMTGPMMRINGEAEFLNSSWTGALLDNGDKY